MIEIIVLIVLGLIAITAASIQDIKMREVANWLNFSLIIFALGFRVFYSLFSSQWQFLLQGLIGLAIFFVLGNLLYYSRVFAGGDAKLMIALGSILPLSLVFRENLVISFVFLFLFLFVGALYGLIYSFVIPFGNFKRYRREFAIKFKENKKFVYSDLVVAIILLVLGWVQDFFVFFAFVIFIFPYLYIHAKTVENGFMIKLVALKDLREGDWLYRNLKVGRKLIKSNWEGLTTENIKLIQNKYRKKVLIKQGIPFVPVFLIAFVVFIWLWFGNWGLIVGILG